MKSPAPTGEQKQNKKYLNHKFSRAKRYEGLKKLLIIGLSLYFKQRHNLYPKSYIGASISNNSFNSIFDLLIELLKQLNILIRGFPITTTMHL